MYGLFLEWPLKLVSVFLYQQNFCFQTGSFGNVRLEHCWFILCIFHKTGISVIIDENIIFENSCQCLALQLIFFFPDLSGTHFNRSFQLETKMLLSSVTKTLPCQTGLTPLDIPFPHVGEYFCKNKFCAEQQIPWTVVLFPDLSHPLCLF